MLKKAAKNTNQTIPTDRFGNEIQASAVRTLEGLPVSVPMFSRSILHPEGEKYTSGVSKGKVKKITQFASDNLFTDLISDGYSDSGKVAVETLKVQEVQTDEDGGQKYANITLRWIAEDLTDDQSDTVKSYRKGFVFNGIVDMIDQLAKKIINTANNPSLLITETDCNMLLNHLSNSTTNAATIMDAKVNGIKLQKDSVLAPKMF